MAQAEAVVALQDSVAPVVLVGAAEEAVDTAGRVVV
jgi:hypothetical protein